MPCHCGQSGDYNACCRPLHNGDCRALSAEQLMRSRYSAFVVVNEPYLLETWHPTTRPNSLDLDPKQKWIGLKVLDTVCFKAFEQPDEVEFVARFKINGKDFLWSSTFTTFIPYKNEKTTVIFNEGTPEETTFESGLFEYTWLNTLSFQVWKGIGVGISGGLRQADFEFDGTQSLYSVGLTYNF